MPVPGVATGSEGALAPVLALLRHDGVMGLRVDDRLRPVQRQNCLQVPNQVPSLPTTSSAVAGRGRGQLWS